MRFGNNDFVAMMWRFSTVILLACAPLSHAQFVISEFLAVNHSGLKDEDGDTEDWIEISNPSSSPANLQGWNLTDDPLLLQKWTIPARILEPGQFLIVFASGKDRAPSAGTLHANFRLSQTGDYLALIQPDGRTIAMEYRPAYPPQIADVSYGAAMSTQTNIILAADAIGRFWVPTDDRWSTNWIFPDFDDSGWETVQMGIGFALDGALANAIATPIGDMMHGINSSAYVRMPFVSTNLADLDRLLLNIRYDDGFVAYLNGVEVARRNAPAAAAGGVVASSASDWSIAGDRGFHGWYYGYYNQTADRDGAYDPWADFNNTDALWTWNGGAWVLGPANPPWDFIAADTWHPNGDNSGGNHWVIRRWISSVGGTAQCRLRFAKNDSGCGNGVTLRLLCNGEQRFVFTLNSGDSVGIDTNVVLTGVQPGDLIDFALDATGPNGARDDTCDGCSFQAEITQEPTPPLVWDSAATTVRNSDSVTRSEPIDLTRFLNLLVTGTNLLAIHGLNAQSNDPSFFLEPQLIAISEMPDANHGIYFIKPTPGTTNSPGNTALGPIITEVSHEQISPATDDDLVVTARCQPALSRVGVVTLNYRVMFGAELSVPMHDDGLRGDVLADDGFYTGIIPAHSGQPGQMLRYYLQASDTDGRATRSPSYLSPTKSPQYYGTVILNPTLTNSHLPVLHWFIEKPAAADSDATARCCLYYQGEFYDNIGVNQHGQSTRGFPKRSYDLDFHPGYHFRWSTNAPRVDDLNLLTTWGDKTYLRNQLAHDTYRDSGSPHHFAFPVRVQRNGAFYSVANLVENGDDNMLKRLGLNPRGAFYKMYNLADSVANAEKKTRKNEGTADLQALIAGMRQANLALRRAYLYDHLDLPEIINFLAAKMITADTDCCHKNYYLYRDTEGTGEWQFMPWDVDLSFGRVWTCSSPCYAYFDEIIYTNQSIFVGYGNAVLTPVFDTPATRQMFLRRLRTLMDRWLQPPGTPAANDFYQLKVQVLRDQIAPDAALDLIKWGTWGQRETITQAVDRIRNEFLPGRRLYMFHSMSATNRGEIPNSQPANALINFGPLEYRALTRNPDEEWLSLTNANAFAVDLSDWTLSGGVRFQFKPGTVIPAGSALIVSPKVAAFRARTASPKGQECRLAVGPYKGNLSSWGETLTLTDTAGRVVSELTYPGNPSPVQKYFRVVELMYHPPASFGSTNLDAEALEFIEFCNTGEDVLDLHGVRLVDGVQFDFSNGSITRLAPGERLLVVHDTNAFALRYGSTLPVAGQYAGTLANEGERLRLLDSYDDKIVDINYDPAWYRSTDGHGDALVLNDENRLPSDDGSIASNWCAALPTPGTPTWRRPAPNHLTIEFLGTACRLRYTGTPGRICQWFSSTNLTEWTTVLDHLIPASGVLDYTVTPLPAIPTYYRAQER
jgi:hypothetical protein